MHTDDRLEQDHRASGTMCIGLAVEIGEGWCVRKRITLWILAGMLSFGILTVIVHERESMIRVGALAPEFMGQTHDGREIRLSAYRGPKNVVLYFYPQDFTSGCTAEACSFRDN